MRGRLVDVVQSIRDEFAVSISTQTLNCELHAVGYRKLTARPRRHAQDADAVPTFKKLPRSSGSDPGSVPSQYAHQAVVAGRGAGRPKKLDHATLGKTRDTPVAPKGSADEISLYFWRYLPGARQGCGLVLPFCKTQIVSLHMTEISRMIALGAHAIVLMDQAERHTTGKLIVPDNLNTITMPTKRSEMNPVENILQFMREHAREFAQLKVEIEKVDDKLMARNRNDEYSQRRAQIPSIGPVGASLLMMKLPDPKLFRSGRDFAAWISLTPKDHPTAGKARPGVITRVGDEYLRSVLVVAATAVVQHVLRAGGKNISPWLLGLLERKNPSSEQWPSSTKWHALPGN